MRLGGAPDGGPSNPLCGGANTRRGTTITTDNLGDEIIAAATVSTCRSAVQWATQTLASMSIDPSGALSHPPQGSPASADMDCAIAPRSMAQAAMDTLAWANSSAAASNREMRRFRKAFTPRILSRRRPSAGGALTGTYISMIMETWK
jgi:hypothetical protein